MNENIKLVLAKITARVLSPGDWKAACFGAAMLTGIMHTIQKVNLSIFITVGAGLGVLVKKLLILTFRRPILHRKAENLRKRIMLLPFSPKTISLLYALEFEILLWKDGISSSTEFKCQLRKLIHHFRTFLTYYKNQPMYRQLTPPGDN